MLIEILTGVCLPFCTPLYVGPSLIWACYMVREKVQVADSPSGLVFQELNCSMGFVKKVKGKEKWF